MTNSNIVNESVLGSLKVNLRKNGVMRTKVKGKSMFPLFTDGSIIQVSFCDFSDIYKGDIAVFKDDDSFTCHRVIKKINLDGQLLLKTKSDNSFYFDPPVKREELIGKVIAFEKCGHNIKISNSISRIAGLFLAFTLPVVARIIFYFKNQKK